jgi:succinate dehydrogenase / fumarate reductase, membrane anchor subunit
MSERGRPLRSDIARVRGLGSAKEGVQHWWMQRLSAVLLVPLALWFVAGIVCHTGADHAAISAWLAQPLTFGLMVLFLGASFYHGQLGLQVVIEDYVHHEAAKITLIVLAKLAALALALATLVALMVIAFGS